MRRKPRAFAVPSRFGRWMAGFLALCLAVAGVGGLNSTVHRWIEHGGTGEAHVHFGGGVAGVQAASHSHNGHFHSHDSPPVQVSRTAGTTGARSAAAMDPTPRVDLCQAFRTTIALVVKAWSDVPAPPADDSGKRGHEHHGLVQLMAAGALDTPLDPCGPEIAFIRVPSPPLPPETLPRLSAWNPQTASRGPPALPG